MPLRRAAGRTLERPGIIVMVAATPAPGRGVGQRQVKSKPACRLRGLVELVVVRVSKVVVGLIVLVVGLAVGLDQPHDKGAEIDDAEADQEDPRFEAHAVGTA